MKDLLKLFRQQRADGFVAVEANGIYLAGRGFAANDTFVSGASDTSVEFGKHHDIELQPFRLVDRHDANVGSCRIGNMNQTTGREHVIQKWTIRTGWSSVWM